MADMNEIATPYRTREDLEHARLEAEVDLARERVRQLRIENDRNDPPKVSDLTGADTPGPGPMGFSGFRPMQEMSRSPILSLKAMVVCVHQQLDDCGEYLRDSVTIDVGNGHLVMAFDQRDRNPFQRGEIVTVRIDHP